ncbi:hypothetical protein [Rathayibacter sp. Leaf248]|uniref:hypothetical protein n=1 Tax=Rathayibacter sp. Leaf248 TaxID=2876555 RepID=UPI001E2E7ACC|nr:hypothetical protein [Rathayibacter sp. Leaf248]
MGAFLVRGIDIAENLSYILGGGVSFVQREIFPTSLGSDLYLAIEREPGDDAHVDLQVDLVTTDDGPELYSPFSLRATFTGAPPEEATVPVILSSSLPTVGVGVPRPGTYALIVRLGELPPWPVHFAAEGL